MSSKEHDVDRKHARRIHKRLKSVANSLTLIMSSEYIHFDRKEYDLLTSAENCLAAVLEQLAVFGGTEQPPARKPVERDPMSVFRLAVHGWAFSDVGMMRVRLSAGEEEVNKMRDRWSPQQLKRALETLQTIREAIEREEED